MTAGPAAPDPGSPDGLEFVRVDIHDGLIGAILKNADEDLNGFNGTREQEAEHYVRWLESERERLIEIADNTPEPVTAREGAATAPGQAAYEAHAAMLVPQPWRWDQLDDKLRAAWEAAAQAAVTAAAAAQPARRTITDQELAADPAYRAYEAYVMAAPDDLNFPEWEDLPEWQRQAIGAAAQEAYETRARLEAAAQPAPGDVLAERNPARAAYEARREAQAARIGGRRAFAGWGALNEIERAEWWIAVRAAFAAAAAQPEKGSAEAQAAPGAADGGPCPGCESLRRQHAETCGEAGFLAGALSEIARRTAGSGQGLAITAHGIARDALERLHAGGAAPADGLAALVRDMLQAFPDTADEQEWRDRAGALGICGPDGKPYRAYTEEGL